MRNVRDTPRSRTPLGSAAPSELHRHLTLESAEHDQSAGEQITVAATRRIEDVARRGPLTVEERVSDREDEWTDEVAVVQHVVAQLSSLGNHVEAIEDWCQEEPRESERRQDVLDIAEVDVDGSQEQSEARP